VSTGVERLDGASEPKRRAALNALTLAFVRDPIMRWVFSSPEAYLTHFERFASAMGSRAFAAGTAWMRDDASGAALWFPPRTAPDADAVASVVLSAIAAEKRTSAVDFMEQMGRFHPHEPHWYLAILGIDAARQGQGLGGGLMQGALERCDDEGLVAYLESSNPANVSFYRRYGFEVIGEIQAGDSPVMLPMLRPAR
jgi:ribosomal protein S18 acetylase RimI-like enzyme